MRKCADVGTEARQLGGALDLFLGGVLDAPGDVLAQSRTEEKCLLRHEADLMAQPFGIDVMKIHAIERDGAAGWIQQTRDQIYERALAAPRVADDRNRGAGWNAEIHFAQDVASGIAHLDIVEFDLASDGRNAVRQAGYRGSFAQQLFDALP